MPLYEYDCRACGHRFEVLVFGKVQPVCPNCQGTDLEKAFSTFATASAETSGATGNCAMRTPSGGCSASGGG